MSALITDAGAVLRADVHTMGRIASVTTRKTISDPQVTLASGIAWAPMSSQLKDLTHGNGLTLTHTWTQDYELGRCEVKDGAIPVIDLSYARGDALNLTGITDAVTAGNSMGFAYSPANRLTSATGPWGTLAWSYDGVGNRTQEVATPSGGSAATDAYAYPGTSNRIATVTRGGQRSYLALPIHARTRSGKHLKLRPQRLDGQTHIGGFDWHTRVGLPLRRADRSTGADRPPIDTPASPAPLPSGSGGAG